MYDYERTSYTAVVIIVLSILLVGVLATVTNTAPDTLPEGKECLA